MAEENKIAAAIGILERELGEELAAIGQSMSG